MPYFLAIAAVFFYATLTAIGKKVLVDGVNGFTYIAISMAFLSLFSFFASVVTNEGKFNVSGLNNSSLMWMIIMAFINFIGFSLYTMCIKDIPVFHYQILGLLGPLMTAFLAYFLLQEPFHMKYAIGLAIMGVGLYVAMR